MSQTWEVSWIILTYLRYNIVFTKKLNLKKKNNVEVSYLLAQFNDLICLFYYFQVLRLLQDRRSLPSLSSLQMQDEHERLHRARANSDNKNSDQKRQPCQVLLSSNKLSVGRTKMKMVNVWESVCAELITL